MVVAPLFAVTSSNWWLIWLVLEIITFSLIACLYFYNSLLLSEVRIIYFVVQSIRGVLLLIGGSYLLQLLARSLIYYLLIGIGLAIKLGLFPVHFWIVPIISSLSLWHIGLLFGPLKIIPLNLLHVLINSQFVWYIICRIAIIRIIYGSSLGLLIANLKSILGASSISHRGWFILAYSFNIIWFYFIAYYVSLVSLLGRIFSRNGKLGAWRLIRLRGLPPFILFMAKANVIMAFIARTWSNLLLIFPLRGAVVSLYFYLKYSYALWLESCKVRRRITIVWILVSLAVQSSILILY